MFYLKTCYLKSISKNRVSFFNLFFYLSGVGYVSFHRTNEQGKTSLAEAEPEGVSAGREDVGSARGWGVESVTCGDRR